jgi:hypothetical protein
LDAIGRYEESRKMQIVRTYPDEARSGPNIEGRNGLRDLIHELPRINHLHALAGWLRLGVLRSLL